MQKDLTLKLPIPPSDNRIHVRVKNKVILTQKARNHRDMIYLMLTNYRNYFKDDELLHVKSLTIQPAHPQGIDICNCFKRFFDDLEYAKVYKNDRQIVAMDNVRLLKYSKEPTTFQIGYNMVDMKGFVEVIIGCYDGLSLES